MNTQRKERKWLQTAGFIVLLSLCSVHSYAAYNLINPGATTPETSYAYPGNAPDWLNNAIFTNSYGTVSAEVWDETGGDGMYAEVHDNASHSFTIHLGQYVVTGLGGTVVHPDVILGGDPTHNYMAVVFTGTVGANSNVYIEVYTINGVGTTGFSPSTCSAHTYQIGNSGVVGNAHIDVAYEPDGVIYVKADRFVVAWEDAIGVCQVLTNPGARAAAGSLSALAGCSVSFSFAPGCLNNTGGPNIGAASDVDVAVGLDYNAGGYIAYFTYRDYYNLSYNIYQGDWHLGGVLNPGTISVGSTDPKEWPRIDMYDSPIVGGGSPFEIAYRFYDNGTNKWNISKIDNNSNLEITANYTPSGAHDHDNSKPVIAAGTEDLAGPLELYSIAYANPDLTYILEENIDNATGAIYQTATSDDFRIVNNNNTIDAPVAISSDYIYDAAYYQMRPDNLFTCWYNTGGSIDCKTRNTAPPMFRPGNTSNNEPLGEVCQVQKAGEHVKVYPIPVQDVIYINRNGRQARSYSITDLTGRLVLKGNINEEVQAVDIASLDKGMYLLNVRYSDGDDVDGIRIAK